MDISIIFMLDNIFGSDLYFDGFTHGSIAPARPAGASWLIVYVEA
jgi:hypothetical protein